MSIRMRRFLEYIEQNLEQDISLEEMADSAGVSKTEALRCFHKTLQTTPYSYVMEMRLSKARYMMGLIPVPTIGINIIGAFLIGVISAYALRDIQFDPRLLLFLRVGICGGFTTFFTFSLCNTPSTE